MSPSSTSSRRGSTSPTIACRRRQASWPSPSAPPSSSRPSSSSGGPTPTSPGLQIRKDHRLVTAGVYELVRHPMYSAHLLWAAAQLLLLQNAIAGPAFLVASLPLYAARIPREEEMMLDQFGDEYRRHAERTGRGARGGDGDSRQEPIRGHCFFAHSIACLAGLLSIYQTILEEGSSLPPPAS